MVFWGYWFRMSNWLKLVMSCILDIVLYKGRASGVRDRVNPLPRS